MKGGWWRVENSRRIRGFTSSARLGGIVKFEVGRTLTSNLMARDADRIEEEILEEQATKLTK